VGVRFQAGKDISGLEKLYKSNENIFFLLEMLVTGYGQCCGFKTIFFYPDPDPIFFWVLDPNLDPT
jgi:hypothetical protein